MIKKILFGTLCITQISIISAKEVKKINSATAPVSSNILFQKVPKTVIIKTKKFKIRIDKQPNGKYLYQSWAANAKITSKPSMIISDGELVFEGSGGNYNYNFINNGYNYQVQRNIISDTTAPYTLVVYDTNDKLILKQNGQIVKN